MHFLKNRLKSFVYAFQGIKTMFRETPNALIHLILTILAITLGFILRISTGEWLAVCIVIGLVFAAEAINTAVEKLADYACEKQPDPTIKKVKDLAAAGVLFAALAALAVGIVVFLPKII
ncbi:MAG: diacylglycerol kinase family protein [Petrimonas sp.]|nr:diacylglycerol kinase family protein [Petrimonas sp.]